MPVYYIKKSSHLHDGIDVGICFFYVLRNLSHFVDSLADTGNLAG